MLKRLLLFGILLAIFPAGLASAQSASVSSAINWLIGSQNSDKSWGTTSSLTTQITATVETLVTLKLNGNTGAVFDDALNWLNGQRIDYTISTSSRLMTKARSSLDFRDDLNCLLSLRNSVDGSWGLDSDYIKDPLETSLALQALKLANYSCFASVGNGPSGRLS